MTQSRTSQPFPGAMFKAAATIMLRTFVCNISDAESAAAALQKLDANQDADVGLAELGLEPVEFAQDALSAADVGDIVARAAADIEALAVGPGSPAAELHHALRAVLEQLDLIGIADWHGAEGLALADARQSVIRHAALAPDAGVIANEHQARLEQDLEREAITS